ncbi:hypothetical protein NDU88_004536 [Pleurodeles waltl]|uniref:Uncharacterized protein n=1 Tax=Pleurodeles waltl TaxID=8319 RepID=A0AAV7M6L0_PLEWA|nr:hypothetical protein NDU88_004536 [Pleurodeles waltl]
MRGKRHRFSARTSVQREPGRRNGLQLNERRALGYIAQEERARHSGKRWNCMKGSASPGAAGRGNTLSASRNRIGQEGDRACP